MADKRSQALDLPEFKDFVPEILDGLEDAFTRAPFDDFDAGKVFNFWVAELFETTKPGSFVYTDGGNELGIDFYVQSEHSYYIYQCKSAEVETLLAASKPPKFDADDVNQILEGIDYLRNVNTRFKSTKSEIRDLRTRYQRDIRDVPDETHLYATLAIMGELTPGGRDRLESERLELAKSGVTLRLISWEDLYSAVHTLEPLPLKGMKIRLMVDDCIGDILFQNNWIYALVYARDLIDAYEEYGVRLFDMNVRHEIKSSKVNRAIVDSLGRAHGRKLFHHLNNGLLIVCNNYKIPKKDGDPLTIHEPQVINGCQTVSSLWRAYKDMTPEEQSEMRNEVKVQVKVIQQAGQELVDEVVITTNNQNPMKPRNLKSNAREQRETQKGFRELPDKWFYVRKDGEFEALAQKGQQVTWFRKRDYEVVDSGNRTRYRKVENEDVAKAWYSWIGYSGRALQGGTDYFGDDATYETVFKKRPLAAFWEAFGQPGFDKPGDDMFEALTPSAHQYLLARSVAAYVKESNPSPYRNRHESIMRLVKAKKIVGNVETGVPSASQSDIAKALSEDTQFIRTGYLYNMENVMAELYAFILCRRYGAIDPAKSRAILQHPDFAMWCHMGFNMTTEELSKKHQADGILWRIYEFLKWSIGSNYFTEFKFQIEAAARPKMYFARRESIREMKRILLESDELVCDGTYRWKTAQGKKFIESLPDLTNGSIGTVPDGQATLKL